MTQSVSCVSVCVGRATNFHAIVSNVQESARFAIRATIIINIIYIDEVSVVALVADLINDS